MSLHWCQPHHSFIDEFLTLSPSLSLSCYFIFSIVSTITLSVVPGRKRFARGTPLGCVWLEEWKSGRIENGGSIEKWEDRKDFNFPPFCLVGSEKVEEWKK